MTTLTVNNRIYTVIETTNIDNYPCIKRENNNITFIFIARSKRGALISGYLFNDGSYKVF